MIKYKSLPIFLVLILGVGLIACESTTGKNENSDAKIESTHAEESIFNLTGNWHTQNNETISLSSLQGKVLVVVMIYTSCRAACPRLVADMRDIESKMPPKN